MANNGNNGSNGAAKGEIFDSVLEDNATMDLDVLANDPGSASIWSIDQGNISLATGSLLVQSLAGQIQLPSGAFISLNADGTIKYDGTAAMQHLPEGVTFQESFSYTIKMGNGNGALSTATSTFTVTGVNDLAEFSGDDTGDIYEDEDMIGGTLIVTDIDDFESSMQATTQNGSFGTLDIKADGSWTYDLTGDVSYLNDGESELETFTVQSLDGTTHDIIINILGKADPVAETQSESEEETRDTWQLNRAKIIHNGEGEMGDVGHVKGSSLYEALISGFASDSLLHVDLAQVDPDSILFYIGDYDGDNESDDSFVTLDFKDGKSVGHMEITLIGVEMTEDNLWLNGV